ncbi:MAG TPA: VOC family protein [Bacteroidota bacterium]|nr:VOC family protein [Bacteroidota bacterium]
MPTTYVNGKICYVEMPALDIGRSAEFYSKLFGWKIRRRGDGTTAFDDPVGEVSGTWITERPAVPQPGILFYIMVDDIEATLRDLAALGGIVVQPVGADAPEITARFLDPAGNIVGLYQQPANLKRDS